MVFLYFGTLAAKFEFYMASQRPQRYLKTFLEPVAPSSLNMSPYRATATPFVPNIITFLRCAHLRCAHLRCAHLRCAHLRYMRIVAGSKSPIRARWAPG